MKKYFYLSIVILNSLFLLTNCAQAPRVDSPTEAFRQFHAAVRRQDVSAVKQTFSKKTLEEIDSFSARLKTSTNESL